MKRKDKEKLTHEMFVMVSKFNTHNSIVEGSVATTKKNCIRLGIIAQWGYDKNCRFMNQSCNITWKELRKDKKWSIQKIKFTTLYNI